MEFVKLVVLWAIAIIAMLAFLCPTVATILAALYDVGKEKDKQ